jgi:hypothetical protein
MAVFIFVGLGLGLGDKGIGIDVELVATLISVSEILGVPAVLERVEESFFGGSNPSFIAGRNAVGVRPDYLRRIDVDRGVVLVGTESRTGFFNLDVAAFESGSTDDFPDFHVWESQRGFKGKEWLRFHYDEELPPFLIHVNINHTLDERKTQKCNRTGQTRQSSARTGRKCFQA